MAALWVGECERSWGACAGAEMDVCCGRSAWPAGRREPRAGSKRKLLGLLRNEVRYKDRL